MLLLMPGIYSRQTPRKKTLFICEEFSGNALLLDVGNR